MASKRPTVSALTVNGYDRISSLSDAILSHILSFLPTEDSVRTRALSSRWKHLFSLVPILDFQYHSLTNPYRPLYQDSSSSRNSDRNSSTPIDSNPDRTLTFLDFVNWVFNSYDVENMTKFSFSGSSIRHPENSRVLSWISESIRRRVTELHVNVSFHEPQRLPPGIFTCKTITYLSIQGNFVLDVPEDVFLPNLKKLVLWVLRFVDDSSLRRLFGSCVVLEELSLKLRKCGHIRSLDISIPSLKTITIIHGPVNKLDFVFDLPNIENFCYNGGIIRHPSFSFQGFKLLVKANIGHFEPWGEKYESLQKLINVVCNVRKLILSWYTLEDFQSSAHLSTMFDIASLSFPVFCNLTHLTLLDVASDCFDFLFELLDRTPCLQVLELHNVDLFIDYSEMDEDIDFSLASVPACVSFSLKEVIFEGFFMFENEFKFVEFLLKNAKVLDTLYIGSKGSLEEQFEMSKKLLTFSKWSRTCRVVVDPYIC